MVAAGSAVLLASRGLTAEGAGTRRKPVSPKRGQAEAAKVKPAAPAPSAAEKEFERQRASTLATLKTLREVPLPPGGDLPVVFRPRRTRRQGH